jgi:hypothetical protein
LADIECRVASIGIITALMIEGALLTAVVCADWLVTGAVVDETALAGAVFAVLIHIAGTT